MTNQFASLLAVGGGQTKCLCLRCASKCAVLLMEPSELPMHERGRAEELLRHLQRFLKTRKKTETERRCVSHL